ncbi:SRPBCC family protein [Antrihabitans spumae]|uniref:SRPBCC family protein n=1 Tax=Antrihabitans spumae TaxID=3373370 RepID=A0ABW7KJ78_9NOCA
MIDVTHQISAVQRRVGARTLEAGEARVTAISQVYDATVDDVWDACTNVERIPRWFLPITGDLVQGGRYQLEGNASGTIQTCTPPTGFSATWEYGGDVSWIEVRLSPESSERTRFELEHIAHVGDDIWAQFGPSAVGIGWDLSLLGLAGHLHPGAAVLPSESAEWLATAEGLRFMTLSNQDWYQANVAAGTPEDVAALAAERALAAYTAGEDPA